MQSKFDQIRCEVRKKMLQTKVFLDDSTEVSQKESKPKRAWRVLHGFATVSGWLLFVTLLLYFLLKNRIDNHESSGTDVPIVRNNRK